MTTYHPPNHRPSKHRNAKRTKGRKWFASASANWQAERRRMCMKKENRYRD